ncbi:hypothetical protein [Caldilinea sp.]|nr:hypothetical protein [Caldilinea sp.]
MSGTTKTGELCYRPFGVIPFASDATPTNGRILSARLPHLSCSMVQ